MQFVSPAAAGVALGLGLQISLASPTTASPVDSLDGYNVIWDSPSADSHGSMPLGNGDIGINAWVEKDGDLVFYISKTDAWDENGRLCKIGRIRVKFDPPLAVKDSFRQELQLRDGLIAITSKVQNQPLKLVLWVDADHPVVRLEAESAVPVMCRAEVELWRLRERPFGANDDSHSGGGLSARDWKPAVLPDVLLASAVPRIAWYHRNTRSVYELGLQVQHLESLKGKFPDPLLNRTFGASLRGAEMVQDGPKALKSSKAVKSHRLAICVLAERADTADAWLKRLDSLEQEASRAGDRTRRTTADWWRGFWEQSWVFAEEVAAANIPANSHSLRVGTDSSGGNHFQGEIASAAIHDSALSQTALRERKTPGEPIALPREVAPANQTWPNGLTLEAWIKPSANENGRIFDKCTPGTGDGLVLDAQGNSLRLILGQETVWARDCLKPGEWQHVAAVINPPNSGGWAIYANGNSVARGSSGKGAPSEVTRGYVLQRYMTACSGRGGSPIKFNGSIFTVEDRPGASPETPEGNPDWRAWGGNYWFQNTRLAYWPMLAAGNFEMMQPLFRMYLEAVPLSEARMNVYYKFIGAAVFPETMYFWGLPNNGDYGWDNTAPEPANGYIRRYWSGGLELTALMLDRYDFTQDEDFARKTLVPLADPLICFIDQYWPKRDAKGKIIFEPAQSLETWHVARNPLPEIAGLRFLLPRMLALPERITTSAQRSLWTRMLGELPPIPVSSIESVLADRRKAGVQSPAIPAAEVMATGVLRPADAFSACANSENPELYAMFPFRLYGVGRPDLAQARTTYDSRVNRHNHGWCQDSIQAACLGLGEEAGRLVSARARNVNGGFRFPAMWGPNFDWIPDQDHGDNILTTLQFMLLQHDHRKLYVLPAWPRNWNVSFKLHAPYKTTVEGVYRSGRLEQLKVTPDSRRQDVEIMTAK